MFRRTGRVGQKVLSYEGLMELTFIFRFRQIWHPSGVNKLPRAALKWRGVPVLFGTPTMTEGSQQGRNRVSWVGVQKGRRTESGTG